ncbi:hypothetical protein PN480_05215 [Dolichospermum circinale CS-1225]|uniref:hypothetical protein n=1 Tax=Dolichospermum circinale TaxID=109265 RepID=UPI00232CA681|nr:hypothetical protein [Dolichospermum circinale]MDB9521354.1 hypothetical protein [Dolichospermum circinale CS-1225]
MKFNCSLKLTLISLFTLGSLPIQNSAIALVNQDISANYQQNLPLVTNKNLTIKKTIQIAENDEYWGSQRDFKIWMPGEVAENTKNSLLTVNTLTETVYMIFHGDLPTDTDYLDSEQIREVLQTSLRKNLDIRGKVIKSTDMVIQGYPGIELLVQHSDGSQGQYQAYVVRGRLYLIGARAKDELTTEASNFFDSFRIYPSRIINDN